MWSVGPASENQTLVYLWNLISYWGSAITLVIMVLALYQRLKAGSPALMLTATVFGLFWAGLGLILYPRDTLKTHHQERR